MTCSLVLLLLLMMKNSNCSFPAVEIISVRSGEPVLLSADLTKAEQKRLNDLRWQHNGQLTLKNNMSKGDGGRCELLADGSLYFSRTETQDSGNYSMRAFDKDGTRIKTREILLRVLSGEFQPSMTSDTAPKAATASDCSCRKRQQQHCYSVLGDLLLPPARFHRFLLHLHETEGSTKQPRR